jgi:hypothetical protein
MRHSVEAPFRLLAHQIHQCEEPTLIVFRDMPLKVFLRSPFFQQDKGIPVFRVFVQTVTQAASLDPRWFEHSPHCF